MNESDPSSVPPNESAKPSEPASAPPGPPAPAVPAAAGAQSAGPQEAQSAAPKSGSPDSKAPNSNDASASPDSSASSSGEASRKGDDHEGSGAATSDDSGGQAEGGQAEGEGSDGQKRRRRRRRRRKAATAEDGSPIETGDAPSDASGAQAAGAETSTRKGPRAKSRGAGRREGGRGGRGQRERGPQGHGHQGHGHQGRGHQGQGHHHGGRDSQHSATVAVRALADMAQALLRVEGVDPLAMPRYLDLQLRVPLDGGNDVRHAAGTAVEQILQRVREVREHEQALRPGAVYSYFADSSHAEGCRPIEPRHVFDGYSSTGKPSFADFVTLAIERKDAGIERMLAGEEIILTHVSMGRVLRTQQLAEFGGASPVFKILGQVDAGLFPVLGEAGRCAFSFQLLRGKTLEGRVRLRLHPVGAVDPMDLADPALMQILSRFQRKLDTEALRLEGKLKGGEVDEEEFVLPLLQEFAKQLQSRTRNQSRRTQHGMERSETSQRPTPKAYPDAREASDDAILWDVDQSTVCVLGPKGRVHVFTPMAKHVTSVVMQRTAVARRRQQGRWRLAEPEERGEFRIQIKLLVAAGEDKVEEQGDVGSGPAESPMPAATPEVAPPEAAKPDVEASSEHVGEAPEGKGPEETEPNA